MDPQLNSALGSIGIALASLAAGWAAGHGLVSAADQPALVNILVTLVGSLVAVGLGWYKAHQNSQTSLIATVNNTQNGVKVVAATSQAPQVDAPIPVPPAPPKPGLAK